MEREYKWKASAKEFKDILEHLKLNEDEAVDMLAQYYDTSSRWLRSHKIALRLRKENDRQMCCLKLQDSAKDGLHVHDEFECAAASLKDGLHTLPSLGASSDLCSALANETLTAVCETKFHRRKAIWKTAEFEAELAFDDGVLICGSHETPFSEIECEQKSGDDKAFETACDKLAKEFSLVSEAKSKFSRAMDLEKADR